MTVNLNSVRVGVLGGGVSPEREISLASAKQVMHALKEQGVEAIFIDILTSENETVKELIMSHKIDVAFIALHGEFGEDGQIQDIIEGLGIAYTGSDSLSSYRAMDKIISKEMFRENKIPTAPYSVGIKGEILPQVRKYPVVVKPYFAGSSLGISIIEEPIQLREATEKAFSFQNKILLEEYIAGRELTVGILDNRALGVIEIIPKKGYFDFKTKYSDDMAQFIAPARLDEETYGKVQAVAISAHNTLGCRHFSRVDIRLALDHIPYVLEVNSIPGLTSHSLLPLSAKCCGLSFNELILKMLALAFHEKEQIQEIKKI